MTDVLVTSNPNKPPKGSFQTMTNYDENILEDQKMM